MTRKINKNGQKISLVWLDAIEYIEYFMMKMANKMIGVNTVNCHSYPKNKKTQREQKILDRLIQCQMSKK